MDGCRNAGGFGITRDRPAQRRQLRRSAPLEIEKKTRLRPRRQRVDRADDLRSLVGGEGNSSRPRHVDYFLNRALQKSPAERSITQWSDCGSRESTRSRERGNEDELLPQVHLDLTGSGRVDARVAEGGNDPVDAIGDAAVQLADDHAL